MRFRFEADALEVVLGEKESKSENKFVGGENRWKYDTFVNWEVSSEANFLQAGFTEALLCLWY